MKVLYYIPNLSGQNHGGIRQYAATLIRFLSLQKGISLYVFHKVKDPEILKSCGPNVQIVSRETLKTFSGAMRWKYYAGIRRLKLLFKLKSSTRDQYFLQRYCQTKGIQIVHCPYQYRPKLTGVKTIATLHDVQELIFPAYFTAKERTWRANKNLDITENADAIMVSYPHIKADLIRYFQLPDATVTVLPNSMTYSWVNDYDAAQVQPAPEGRPQNFLLYPANTWAHKNHLNLVAAIAILRQAGKMVPVVCTGHKTEFFAAIEAAMLQAGVQDCFSFEGVVSGQTLYSLYKTCTGVVVPSKYEAGSFPLMESLMLNVPVICARVTSMPDTIGDARFVFDADDAHDMAQKIEQLFFSAPYRAAARENAALQRPVLMNGKMGHQLMDIYTQLLVPRGV